MAWYELQIPRANEAMLHDALYSHLAGNRSDASPQLVGVPSWLAEIRDVVREARIPLHGADGSASCRVDLLGANGTANFVLEVKHAAKYEPVALAEVLHHSEVLGEHRPADCDSWLDAAPITSVLITQWNGWLRAACQYMWKQMKQPERLRLLEAQALALPETGLAFWISEVEPDEKTDSAAPVGLPASLITSLGDVQWRSARSGAGGVRAERPGSERAVHIVPGISPETWLVWAGGTYEVGKYWVVDAEAGPPPVLW